MNSDMALVLSKESKNSSFTIRVMGTAIRAPIPPSAQPHTIRERKTTRAESPTFLPMMRGEMTLSTTVLATITSINTAKAGQKPDSSSVTKNGGITAMTKPMLGMKLMTKKSNPQSKAKSVPKA